ncbi:hypothetical protein [Devosia ginsengisoli]|uniref:hypothetical protein n=1 Tax=Devosia ginsengisoli TaxID=400770 RepID=UPI0026F246AE|nr:hypothetical protein [Devosia ginsengisoli]MCR6669929.1 hypothetical protein [Devosia ginsengisoli]
MTGENLKAVQRLPLEIRMASRTEIVIQRGHDVNYGNCNFASCAAWRGPPLLCGTELEVTAPQVADAITDRAAASPVRHLA